MPTLAEALSRYLQVDRSAYTLKNYGHILHRMADAVGSMRDISRVSVEDIEDWFYPTVNSRPLKRTTAAEYLRIIQRFFAFCQKRGYVPTSPAESLRVRYDEEEPRTNRSVPPADLRKMLAAAQFHKRNYAMLLFFAVTGCRIGGISTLTIGNLELDRYRARLKEKGSRWVWVRFGPATASALRAWLEVRPLCNHDYVFTNTPARGATPLTKHGIRAVVEDVSRRATGRVYRPHALRHSRGHSLAWKGIPESVTGAVLNHRSGESTRRYYPDDDETVTAVIQAYELAALEDVEDKPKIIPLVS
jgi:integrase/recombinase XerC